MRIKPLKNIGEVKEDARKEFDKKWEEGTLLGWPKLEQDAAPTTDLFCIACKKQYAKETVYNAHLTSKKHIKAAAQLANGGGGSDTSNQESVAEVQSKVLAEKAKPEQDAAWSEFLIQKYAEILKPQIEETKENVERRQTLTGRERDVSLGFVFLVMFFFPTCIPVPPQQMTDSYLSSCLCYNSWSWRRTRLSWRTRIRMTRKRSTTH